MGQKVHPYGFRLGYNKNWLSRWFSRRDYPAYVLEDDKLRKFVKKKLFHAGISHVEIERAGGKVRLIVHTARPGIVIGRKGVEIEKLREELRHMAFRRAMKRTVGLSRKFGAEGIKIMCSGRLAGAEIARTEWYRDGRVPLHTLRADIDYGYAIARTTYGVIGVKVWIFKDEILDEVTE
jgi:small subunit ribosomal protein S3